jgi:hypothetical protein
MKYFLPDDNETIEDARMLPREWDPGRYASPQDYAAAVMEYQDNNDGGGLESLLVAVVDYDLTEQPKTVLVDVRIEYVKSFPTSVVSWDWDGVLP